MSALLIEGCPVKFTQRCVEKIHSIFKQCKSLSDDIIWLRIGIDSTGISGVHPFIDLDAEYHKFRDIQSGENTEFVVHNMNIVIKNRWVPYLKNLMIDYQEGLTKSGFIFSEV